MNDPMLVYFTLANNVTQGATDSFYQFVKLLFLSILISLIFFSISALLMSKGRFYSIAITSRQIKQNKGGEKAHSLAAIMALLSGVIFALSLVYCLVDLRFSDYISLIIGNKFEGRESEFYNENYAYYDKSKVTFPTEKKNVVIILMESIESSFAQVEDGGMFKENLIPHLTTLAKDNVNFTQDAEGKIGGGISVSGSGWTVAAMVSKFLGIPLLTPSGFGNPSSIIQQFLPNATSLFDILAENGYSQVFSMGSDEKFASRGALLKTHNVEVHDINYYKDAGMLDKDYSVFWGFEDEKLYAYAQHELNELSKAKKPFMYGLLTVDTHFPNGYTCQLCEVTEEPSMRYVLRCADRQVFNFVEWIKSQEWYKDTVIVIMGDHPFMLGSDDIGFFEEEYYNANKRYWLDIFINSFAPMPSSDVLRNRVFSSYDMFPTILASMGVSIKYESLAFGVNLFSGKPTLAELYGESTLSAGAATMSKQYTDFMGKASDIFLW